MIRDIPALRARSLLGLCALLVPIACSDVPYDNAGGRSSTGSGGAATVPGRVSGTGSSGLRVREKPTTASAQVAALDEGQVVAILCRIQGETVEGNAWWDSLAEPRGYVAEAFIGGADTAAIPTCDASGAPAPAPSPDGGTGSKPVDIDGPAVRPHVQAFADAACGQVGACRASTRVGHEPSADLALDFPTGAAYGKLPTDGHAFGDKLAELAVANRAQYRIDYVIYRQRINSGQGWKPMEDRGDITANHFDHVHVSFDP